MPEYSYNGWEAIELSRDPRMAAFPWVTGRVLSGDVFTVFDFFCQRFNAEVEPIGKATSWGWAYRDYRGGGKLSCHASGTAIDLNAPKHPWTTNAVDNFRPDQITKINALLVEFAVIRWIPVGDPMHFEIRGDAAAVKRVADRVRGVPTPVSPPVAPPAEVRAREPRRIDLNDVAFVKLVQEACGVRADGVRGTKTADGVRRMQRKLGAGVDGAWGKEATEKYLLALPLLREGSRGVGVGFVQWIAGAKVDQVFGGKTGLGVREMQQWAGIGVDGLVDDDTKRKITR